MAGRVYYPRSRVILDILFEDFAGGAGEAIHIIDAVPVEVEVVRNHHREADTAKIEIEYSDFPIDPRTLRAVRVIVLLGSVAEPTDQLDASNPDHRVFLGFVDEPQTVLSGDGDRVKLEARDATALFLDYAWPTGAAINIDSTLAVIVYGIQAQVPGAGGMPVEIVAGSASINVGEKLGRTKWAPQKGDDAWTVLVELCGLLGLVPVVELDKLRIIDAAAVQTATPARFVYGQNLEQLTYRRRLVESRSSQILVRCWDEQKRERREAIYPPSPEVAKKIVGYDGKIADVDAPQVPYYVSGSFTQADLDALAESIYEEAARNQIEGELQTRDMQDLDEAVDLWKAKNGDRMAVTLGRGEQAAIEGRTDGEALLYLVHHGWKIEAARAYIEALRTAEGAAVNFYTRRAVHRWARADGYQARIEFVNYV
jgi:hypothetical protein